MPAVARLESTLAFNDVQFTQGIDRAEKRAQTFAGKVEHSFQQIFKRSPERRAEKAISGLITDLSTGSLSQGITSFASRLTGLGLAAGVGIGVAVELFDKLHESVVEVRQAHDELDRQMSKPLNLTSIEGLGKAIDNLREKQGTFTHGVNNFLYEAVKIAGGVPGAELGTTQIEEQKEISEAIAKRQAAERTQGRNELIRANVLAGLEDDPKRKALAEMRFKFDERREAIQRSPDKGSLMRLEALDVEQNQAEKNFRLGKAQRSEEFEDTKKLLTLKRLNLAPDKEREVTAALKLESLDRRLENKKLSPEERKSLELQRFSTKTEIESLKPKAPQNPFAFGTQGASKWEDQNAPGFGSLALRKTEANDPSVYGSLAQSAALRGERPLAQNNDKQSLPQLLQQLIQLTQQAWLTP